MSGMHGPVCLTFTPDWRRSPVRAPVTERGNGADARPNPPLRILIAEDEAITAMHIEDIVLDLGHEVVDIVVTGPAAVAAATRLRPDLVLMDIRLAKGTDGIAAAIEIRTALDIPSIFMTAHSDPDTRRRAAEALPVGYAVKPFSRAVIAKLLGPPQGGA